MGKISCEGLADQENIEEIEKHIKAISQILGVEETASNKDTPKRIAKMWAKEVFKNINNKGLNELRDKMTVFPNEYIDGQSFVIVKDIDFSSMCEHHWMPFFGKCTVGYIPFKNIIGLSKIPRVVDYFSKQPQLQEKFTNDIGEFLVSIINPKVLYVIVEAEHTCVMCRGIEKMCSTRTDFKYEMTVFNGCNYYEEFLRRVGK